MKTYDELVKYIKWHNCLPKDFNNQWEIKNDQGYTIAHAAAYYRVLPKGFNKWGLRDNNKLSVAHVSAAAERGSLPEGFNQWNLSTDSGWTVAHVAALFGHLPDNFTQWGLADKYGRTVAHIAAENKRLPKDFNQWDLKDNNGWTVAHESAFRHNIPEGFNKWYLRDNNGRSVFELYLSVCGFLSKKIKAFKDWDMVVDDKGNTCKDIYLENLTPLRVHGDDFDLPF